MGGVAVAVGCLAFCSPAMALSATLTSVRMMSGWCGLSAGSDDDDAAADKWGGVAAGGAHYNPSLHQDGAVGRFVTIGASYSF